MCAESFGTISLESGEFVSNMNLKMCEGWEGTSESRLRRTFAHELGHFLGMDDSTTACAGQESVMKVGVYACDTTSVVPDSPTLSDSLPVTSTVYGDGPRTGCGF